MIANFHQSWTELRETAAAYAEPLWLLLPSNRSKLLDALKECLTYIQRSEDQVLCEIGADEASRMLRRTISKLERRRPINKFGLWMHFQATSDLMDLAVFNGWGDEFCEIADRVDRYL